MRTEERAGVATTAVGIAIVVVLIAGAFYAVLALGPSSTTTATTTSGGGSLSTSASTSLTSSSTTQVLDSSSLGSSSSLQVYAYLEAVRGCTAGGLPAPCFGGNSSTAYVFDCLSQAQTDQGCTQIVGLNPNGNFTVNVVYPFNNSTSPAWSNCFWEQTGNPANELGYGYCSTVGMDSFIVGVPVAQPQTVG